MIGIKNIVFNFLVLGFEPKVDLVNLLLFAVTCVNAVVIDVFRNIISDWLTQFHPSSEGQKSLWQSPILEACCTPISQHFQPEQLHKTTGSTAKKCSHFDNCKHDKFVCLNVAQLSSAKTASQNREGGNYYFLSNSIPYSLKIKLEHTASTKRKIGELQSFFQDPKFRSSLGFILVETGA